MLQVKRSGRSNSKLPKLALDALLGALGAMTLTQMAPWGMYDNAGFGWSTLVGLAAGSLLGLALSTAILAMADGVILVAYFIVSFTPLTNALATRWVRSDPVPASTTGIDAVVVLSSGIKSDSAMSSDAVDRLLTGLSVLKATNAPRLVVTRGTVKYRGQAVTVDRDQERLADLAGVSARMTIVGPVAVTRDEAVRTAALLGGAPGTHHIVVVTSPLHTRRACALFEKVGFVVSCVPAIEREFVTRDARSSKDRLAAMRFWTYEVAGTWKSKMKGWL